MSPRLTIRPAQRPCSCAVSAIGAFCRPSLCVVSFCLPRLRVFCLRCVSHVKFLLGFRALFFVEWFSYVLIMNYVLLYFFCSVCNGHFALIAPAVFSLFCLYPCYGLSRSGLPYMCEDECCVTQHMGRARRSTFVLSFVLRWRRLGGGVVADGLSVLVTTDVCVFPCLLLARNVHPSANSSARCRVKWSPYQRLMTF